MASQHNFSIQKGKFQDFIDECGGVFTYKDIRKFQNNIAGTGFDSMGYVRALIDSGRLIQEDKELPNGDVVVVFRKILRH